MTPRRLTALAALIAVAAFVVALGVGLSDRRAPDVPSPGLPGIAAPPGVSAPPGIGAPSASTPPSIVADAERADGGFRSEARFREHYAKHGREFGRISAAEYLALAKGLRDRPAGGAVLEAARTDGVVSRFDRESGAFLAFERDGTIRTFFKPRDGEAYFRRQADRPH